MIQYIVKVAGSTPSIQCLAARTQHVTNKYSTHGDGVVYTPSIVLKCTPTHIYRATLCQRGTSYGPASVTSRLSIEMDERTNRASFWHGSFRRPILHCVCKETRALPAEIRVLPSGTLSRTLDLEISPRQVDRVASQTHRRSRLLTTLATVDASRLDAHTFIYYTSVDRNALTPLLRFIVDLLYNLFQDLCSSQHDFDRHSASRGPSAIAELLVRRCTYLLS